MRESWGKVGDKVVLAKPSVRWCVCRWMLLYHTTQRVTMLVLERAHMLTRALQKTYLPSTTGWTSKFKKKKTYLLISFFHMCNVHKTIPHIKIYLILWHSSCSTNRKRTLKFDVEAGLVSDSMVGNSLYLQNQNVSDASSSGGAPLKTEPVDSS